MPDPTPQSSECATERTNGAGIQALSDAPFETWPGTVAFTAPLMFDPASRAELAHAVLQAEAAGHHVRAFGSKWSFSDAVRAATGDRPGAMIATQRLNKNLDVDLRAILAPGTNPDRLCHVEAGRKARDLIGDLGARGLMLEAGGASGQSVGGMMSTSTHSSESTVQPFVDYVRAIHLIGAGAVEHWIERDRPITDPARLQRRYPCLAPGNIRYDTKLFNAVLVSAGCMGVIYSVIVEAVPAFGIRRHRFATTWEQLLAEDRDLTSVMGGQYMLGKSLLPAAAQDILGQSRQLIPPFLPNVFSQIIINPYPFYGNDNTLTGQERAALGQHLCFVTNRVKIPVSAVGSGPPPKGPLLETLGSGMGNAALWALGTPANPADAARFVNFENSIKHVVDVSERAAALVDFLAGHYAPGTVSAAMHYLLANILPAGDSVEINTNEVISWSDTEKLRGFCVEGAFPVPAAVAYTQQVLDLVAAYAQRHPPVYVGGYLALRIVGQKTDALLGMQRWSPTCHVEYMGIAGTRGLPEFVNELQTRAIALGGILHLGMQNDAMTAADMRTAFGPENIEAFRRARGVLSRNGRLATFDNSFTDRLGLSARRTIDPSYLVPLLLGGS